MSLQTALKWKVRPLAFLGIEGEGPWTETDRLLAEALESHSRMVCKDCGWDSRLAWDDDLEGWFEVSDETVCQACAARERYLKDRGEAEPGQKLGVKLDPNYHNKR